jgi:hypothetical protein
VFAILDVILGISSCNAVKELVHLLPSCWNLCQTWSFAPRNSTDFGVFKTSPAENIWTGYEIRWCRLDIISRCRMDQACNINCGKKEMLMLIRKFKERDNLGT